LRIWFVCSFSHGGFGEAHFQRQDTATLAVVSNYLLDRLFLRDRRQVSWSICIRGLCNINGKGFK
jgi:hypothetical protein